MTNNDNVNEPEPNNETNANINTISELPGRPFKITVEVPLFLTLLGVSLSGVIAHNILLYRTCVHALNHSKEDCHAFLVSERSNTTKVLEDEVQKYSTYVSMVKMLVDSIGPAILSLFVGAWSDTYGRKPLIVWPLFGMAFSSIMFVVYSLLDTYGPWWIIVTAIPSSMCGGYSVLFTGAFTYVSDITNTKNRSLRLTVLEVIFSLGSICGSMLSSYLIRAIGNILVLLINATLYVMAYAYSNVYLTESLNGAQKGGLFTLLDFLLVKEMVSTCFKKRPRNGKIQIILVAISCALSIFFMYGLFGLSYLYTREKLHWAIKEYSIYSSVNTLIVVVGAMVTVKFGKACLGLGDLALAMIGYLSSIAEFVALAFAASAWTMYMASAFGAFKGLSTALIRSHLTKVLPGEDIGKVFALICASEAICPLISPLIYNALYEVSLSTFPGSIFILSAFLCLICVVLVGFTAYYNHKGTTTNYETLNNEAIVGED